MVLAIATPAMALIWEPHSPGFSGCPGSGQVLWEFTEPGCMPTSDVADTPYHFDPCVPDPVFGNSGAAEGGPVEGWTWSGGVYTVNGEDGLNQPIPDNSDGKQYLRMYVEVVHTITESGDLSLIGFALEIWDREDWSGCPEGAALTGTYDGYYFEEPTDTFDLGDGWHQSHWVFDFSTEVGAEFESPILQDATHTAVLFGMLDEGNVYPFDLEEVFINYIWYDEADFSDIPTEDCECIICREPPIITDSNDIPIYEPQDVDGPEPMGPTDGQLKVSLAWPPGEDLGYPAFTATVVVDPDPNHEHVGSADFSFTKPVPPDPNGNVTLYFTEANWDQYQNVHVEATEDLLKEGLETFTVELTITIDIDDPNFGGPGYDPVVETSSVRVVDNDIPYISVLPRGHLWKALKEKSPGVQRCANVRLSHVPTDDVEVRGELASNFDILLENMVVMDPNFEEWTDPNHLLFTPGNYNVAQQICFEAIDDPCLAQAWLEWVPGVLLLNGISDDPRYNSEAEGGELEDTMVNFNVQDNECGSVGYPPYDVNEDCYVDLSEVAALYGQWLYCTLPYDSAHLYGPGVPSLPNECDKSWLSE